jgi:hypothetical protein
MAAKVVNRAATGEPVPFRGSGSGHRDRRRAVVRPPGRGALAALPEVMVWKAASCGFCEAWVKHMRSAGFSHRRETSLRCRPPRTRVISRTSSTRWRSSIPREFQVTHRQQAVAAMTRLIPRRSRFRGLKLSRSQVLQILATSVTPSHVSHPRNASSPRVMQRRRWTCYLGPRRGPILN